MQQYWTLFQYKGHLFLYRDSHDKDKMVYLYHEDPHTDKMVFYNKMVPGWCSEFGINLPSSTASLLVLKCMKHQQGIGQSH